MNDATSISFVEHVRRQLISSPVHKSFNLEKWESGYKLHKSDENCDALFNSGLFINKVLSALRSEFQKISRWNNRATHIRYLIGLANKDDLVLVQKVRSNFSHSDEDFLINSMQEFKVNLPYGAHTPDEISQSLVESLSTAISHLLKTEIVPAQQITDDLEKLNVLSADLGICGLYQWIESIWEDCLWNGYSFSEIDKNTCKILPTSTSDIRVAETRSITDYRRITLLLHQTSVLGGIWHRLAKPHKSKLMPISLVSGITKEGKRKRFIFGPATDDKFDDAALFGFVAKDMVSFEYYQELLSECPKELKGNSVNQLIDAWLVLRSISMTSSRKFVDSDVFSPTTLLGFAPTYHTQDVARVIANCLHVELDTARRLVEFFTFTGKSNQTLYTQPLINLGNDTLVFSSSSLHRSNPIYVIERWLSQLSVDISKKGTPFEDHVRTALHQATKSPAISSQFQILSSGFKFSPGVKGERPEEIDLIFILGNTAYIGELKCAIVPTESTDYYNNRQIIAGAVTQVTRKVACIERNAMTFRRALMKRGISLSETYAVEPIVVLNNVINSGFPINDVAVVDLLIIERYLEGFLVDRARADSTGNLIPEHKIPFYDSAESARDYFLDYLKSPPQLRHIRGNVHPREIAVPIKAVDGSLPELKYVSFETGINLKEVIKLQDSEASTKS